MWNTKSVKDKVVRVCAWCNKVFIGDQWIDIGYIKHERDKVTHGICENCAKKSLLER